MRQPMNNQTLVHEDHHAGNRPHAIRRAKVLALYRSGLSLRDVAEQVGVTFQAVHRMLVRMGEPTRQRGGNTGSHSRHRK
jgi:transposase